MDQPLMEESFSAFIAKNMNQLGGQVTLENIGELLKNKVQLYANFNGWFSSYEKPIDLVFDDQDPKFMWKYTDGAPIWGVVEIKPYSSHLYINNQPIFYKP